MDNPLVTELSVYESNKSQWLEKHEGQYVLIKGEEVVGFFDGEFDAARIGFDRFGYDTPILVRQITSFEPVLHIKGENVPCLLSL